MLVMEAMANSTRCASGRSSPLARCAHRGEPPSEKASKLEREIVQLSRPRSVDEILDEVQSPDLDVLHVMKELAIRGGLRRIPRAAL